MTLRLHSFVLIAVFILIFLCTEIATAQVTKEELVKTINVGKLEHPYLFFTNDEKKVLQERVKTDPQSKRIMTGLLAEGHRFLNMPITKPAPQHPKHPRFFVEQNEATRYASELREGALTLAFLYQMTGEQRYAQKAAEFALALCDAGEWVNPAHVFDIIYPRVWPWNVPDDQVVFSYDITAADKAHDLAIVYDWIYPAMSKTERDKLRGALLEKAITRVRGNYEFHWWATSHRCNWSAICFSGLGMTALSLLPEYPQLMDVVAESYNRIGLTFDEIGEDGGWQEGRGYYGYMLRVSVRFMDVIKRLTKGKHNLFQHKRIKNNPMDFVLYSMTANFEDSGGGPVGGADMVDKLVEETKSASGAWYREQHTGRGNSIFSILWPRTTVTPVEPAQKSKLFRTINWAMMRSDFLDQSSMTIALKAGYNDDPHHGHLDCGQFMITWHGVPFIRDIGRMSYDEYYFNEDRWLYPFASSDGHNLIFVNDERQVSAKLKDKQWKQGIGGEILTFETSATRDYALMDPTKAYPGKELKKWRRSIVLEKPVVALVVDEVEAAIGSKIEARFFPGAGPIRFSLEREPDIPRQRGVEYTVSQSHVLLRSQEHNLLMVPLVLDNTFSIIEGELATIPVMKDARVDWIPYMSTLTTSKTRTSVVVTLFVPAGIEQEVESIVRSAKVNQAGGGALEVSVSAQGKNYRWVFEKQTAGYVLKNQQ